MKEEGYQMESYLPTVSLIRETMNKNKITMAFEKKRNEEKVAKKKGNEERVAVPNQR